MAAPDVLIRKWRKLFHYRDTDKDGIVTKNDFKGYGERLVAIYGERATPALEICEFIWEVYGSRGYKEAVSEEQWVGCWVHYWNYERDILKSKVGKYADISFDVIDSNGDGEISLEEYAVYQNCFGIFNRDYVEHIFKQLDRDGDDVISRKEFVDEILDYVLEASPEKIPELYDHDQAKNFRKS